MHGMPPVLGITMLILGALTIVLTIRSLQYSRVAWSFLCSLMSVMALVTLFGSPKVRNILHIRLGVALLIPGALIVGVVFLSQLRLSYRGTPSQKSQNAAR
jgi:type IV secretory pathway VirB3-like protein